MYLPGLPIKKQNKMFAPGKPKQTKKIKSFCNFSTTNILMQLILAIIGGFFVWLFQLSKKRKKRKTYNEIVWGQKHDVNLFNFNFFLVYLGFIICIVILIIVNRIFYN